MNYKFYYLIVLCFLSQTTFLSAQEADTLKNEVELVEGLVTSAKDDSRISLNNENIDREKLDIKYDIKEINLEKENITANEASQEGISVLIPESDLETVLREWKKEIKRKLNSKIVSTPEGLKILGTEIKQLSDKPINIYSSVRDNEAGVIVVASFEIDSTFVTEENNSVKYSNARKFMRDFGVSQYQLSTKNNIKAEKKNLKDFESKLAKYQKANEKSHKSITENELNIQNTKVNIEQNKIDQKDALEKIRDQKNTISKLDGDSKQAASKELKSMQSGYKKLQNSNKSMEKKIVKYKANIEETKGKIAQNLSEQDLQKSVISKQVSNIKSLEQKLLNIK